MDHTSAQSPQGNRASKVRHPGRSRTRLVLLGSAVLIAGLLPTQAALATHDGLDIFGDPVNIALTGSNFEIDVNANLIRNHASPSLDWASVTHSAKGDEPSGSGDDSFGQGSKEDTPVPTIVAGSIPPNKSDLKNFGTYSEEATNGTEYLHMFWNRVQDPAGTTNMDFEFNQSDVTSSNGVTPERTAGDLLIQYDLSNGGTVPQLFLSKWATVAGTGDYGACVASSKFPCWAGRVNLTTSGLATGSINSSTIESANSDGLGAMSPRTFGEASVDFSAITGGGCNAFGSAYLKSRSSDSFTAALKDYIEPDTLSTPCRKVNITKTDDSSPPVALNGAIFSVYEDLSPQNTPTTGPGTEDITGGVVTSCTTAGTGADAGKCSTGEVLLPGTNYWVVETTTPSGYATASPVRISPTTADVALTFVNPRLFKVIVLVCRADNSLYSSNVTLPSGSTVAADTKKSLASSTSPAAADLCSLTGATFGGLQKGTRPVSVDIGTSAQTP